MDKTKIMIGIIIVCSIALAFAIGHLSTQIIQSHPIQKGDLLNVSLHLLAQHFRNGKLISSEYHAMTLTDFGKEWIKENIGHTGGNNVTKFAEYISTSNNTGAFASSWVVLPSEHLDGSTGLGRAQGTFVNGTSYGTWNLTKSFTSKGIYTTQTYDLSIDSYANYAMGGLVAAEVQATPKNMGLGDTLTVTIMGAIS